MSIARNLTDIQGASVSAPTQNGYSATKLSAYASDAAYVTANGAATTGATYWNTTSLVVRQYDGTAWQDNKILFSTEANSALTGSDQDFTPGRYQIVSFTNASLQSIRSINPAVQKFLILINATGTSMEIKNEASAATAANRIITGTGLDLTIDSGASILCAYDGNASRWRVIGGTGSGGSSDTTSTDINLCTSPDDVVNWVNVGGGTAASTTTTASEIPLYPSKATAIKITNTTVGAYDEWRWQMPASLKNLTFQIDWIQGVQSGASTGEFKVDVYTYTDNTYSSATRKSLRSDSSSVTSIPAMNGPFGKGQIVFDAGSEDYYGVRITRVSGTNWLSLNKFKIGTGELGIAPSDGFWESTTSYTIGGSTSAPTAGTGAVYYRETAKQGAFAIIRYEFRQTVAGTAGSGDYLLPLPTGLSIDYARLAVVSASSVIAGDCGSGSINSAGTTFKATAVAINTGAYINKIAVNYFNETTPTTTWGSASSPLSTASVTMSVTVRIPISGWSDSVLVTAGNAVEYASNDGSAGTGSNTQYTTGSVAGAQGSAFVAVNSVSVSARETTDYVVNFQSPIQSDDVLSIEILWSGNNEWVPLELPGGVVQAFLVLSNASYGMGIVPRNSTSVWVRFGNGGRLASSGYGSAGSPWSGITTYKWRVRKAKATYPAGIPLANSTYRGFVAPRKGQTSLTVTSTAAGWSTIRAVGIYYQDQDGNHRLKFNLTGSFTSKTFTSDTFTIAGVTFKNVSTFFQGCAGATGGTNPGAVSQCITTPNTSNITLATSSGTGITVAIISGDVELESKPTWA